MSRGAHALAASLVVIGLLGLVSCKDDNPGSSPGPDTQTPAVVDTPELRAQKAAAGIADCPPSNGEPAASGGLPDITLPCLGGGRAVNLAQLTGTPTVINFWAQYCGPCKDESAYIQSLYQRAGDQLRVLGVDWQDTSPGAALAFADEFDMTYPQVADVDGETRAALSMPGLPVTIFVDAAGRIVHREIGPILSSEQLDSLVAEYLDLDLSSGNES